jgi:hypothetical protein
MPAHPGEVSVGWAARRLGVHPKTIRAWCQQRFANASGPFVTGSVRRDASRCYWIARAAVEAVAQERNVTA